MSDTSEYPNQARSYLNDQEMERLNEWRKKNGNMSRSSAIRLLLAVGLDEMDRRDLAAYRERKAMEEYKEKHYRPVVDAPQA